MSFSPHSYTINGVKVEFPCKAYPSQLAMMNNITKALQRGQNALLESPTGSGKSLALLCASLAWQKHEIAKAREYNMAVERGYMEPEYEPEEPESQPAPLNSPDLSVLKSRGGFVDDDEDFEDFPPATKRQRVEEEIEVITTKPIKVPPLPKKVKKKFAPRIFFGTRTHKQITQIIRELNKTAYKDCKMTILGSRDHTCIHPTISKLKNRNEGCKELMDRKKGGGCSYHSNVNSKMSSHANVNAYRGNSNAWDLEDLVKVGKKVRACPYFTSRELMVESNIVFCPYNYLVEPLIRKSLDINLRGQVIILDEAHNIEDSARSAASWQVTQDEVQDCKKDLERMAETDVEPASHEALASLCSKLLLWINDCSANLNEYRDFGSSSKVWNGTEIVAIFETIGIGHSKHGYFQEHMNRVLATLQSEFNKEKDVETPTLHSNTTGVLEGFFMVLDYLYMMDMKHRDDYRVALTRSQVRNIESKERMSGMWLGKFPKKSDEPKFKFSFTLNFWCLNPAVSFLNLKESLHSIILTSGTLSPIASFSSELDVKFSFQLEANHVIDKKQVWISTLSQGPTGHSLNATYRNAETFNFQDEIGRLMLGMCQKVPHGVLLFLPSYSMLNKVTERWRQTGLWNELNNHKVVITEPRFSDEFESSIRHYYDIIENTNENCGSGPGAVTGALFIAVCRGKVSEGLDFADNNARAVVCVGIPFPNFKDIQVDLKKKYNDHRRLRDKDILTGNDWYEIQAFRALNQALGRCIRHKQDWGAILMVDDRYQQNQRYIGGLSKWVRSGVVHFNSYSQMINNLNSFNENMKAQEMCITEPKPEPLSAKEILAKLQTM